MKGMVADAERGQLVPELRVEIDNLQLELKDRNTTVRAQGLKISSLKEDVLKERHRFDWGDFFKGMGVGAVLGVAAILIRVLAL